MRGRDRDVEQTPIDAQFEEGRVGGDASGGVGRRAAEGVLRVEKFDAPGVQGSAGESVEGRGAADVGSRTKVDGASALTEKGRFMRCDRACALMWEYPAWGAERQLEEL